MLSIFSPNSARHKAMYKSLYNTARYKQIDVLKKLIENNKNLDFNKSNDESWTAIMIACRYDNSEIIEELINCPEIDVDVNLRDNSGKSALLIAAKWGNTKSIEILLREGAKIDAQDNDGWSALMYASRFSFSTSSFATVKLLVNSGANLDLRNNNGWTALMLATRFSIIKTSRFLLKSGANINIINNHGQKLKDIVIEKRYKSVTKNLVDEILDFNKIKKFDNGVCPVCLDEIDKMKIFLPCGHCFHATCINAWFVQKETDTCPFKC